MDKKQVFAVSGIDTDIGKTIATGVLAYSLREQGCNVFTQKMVQTGCVDISEDILVHRQLMGIAPTEEDQCCLSCPYLFPTPCSPHLAAKLAGESIDPMKIAAATDALLKRYDLLLLEGAGGLFVPLTLKYTFLDYLQEYELPVILVSSPRLGSINHTLSALEVLQCRQIRLAAIIYNLHGFTEEMEKSSDVYAMVTDSRKVMVHYLEKLYIDAEVIDLCSPPQFDREFHASVGQMLSRFLS